MTVMDVMIDVETAGNGAKAAPIGIGAVEFKRGGGLGREFMARIDLDDAIQNGCTVSGSTITWWMSQPDVFIGLQEDSRGLYPVLSDFAKWIPEGAVVWAKGASFDFGLVLRPAYDLCFGPGHLPWRYSKERCMRTLELGRPESEVPHDPLSDAKAQARMVARYYE